MILTVLALTRVNGATFTASLDRDTISLGETATLSLTFQDGQPKNIPPLDVSGLRFVQTGNQTGFNLVNGSMSSTVTITYSITAQRTGEFEIPPLSADVNGQRLTSQPLKLTVEKPHTATDAEIDSGKEIAFAKLTLPKKDIYVGETILADMQLYYRQDAQLTQQPQVTGVAVDGFTVGKIAGGNQFLTQIGNTVYKVIPAKVALTASKTGFVHVGPATINLVLSLPSNRRSDVFDPFGMLTREEKQIPVSTKTLEAKSRPLPSENVPANFNGAVGSYSMTVNAGPTNVTVGDPITVRVQIAGRGAFDDVKLPDQSNWNNFKIFSPTQKTEFSDQLDLQGTKTFEEIVTPENADVHNLPEFSFSFFNPDDGKYHTLTQPPEQLIVRAGGATPLPALAATKNSSSENQTPQDILPIKNDLGTLEQISAGRESREPLISSPIFLGVQSLPVLAFLGALIWRKRADNLANNPRLRRKIAVRQLIQIGIGDLKKYASENNSEQFFATLFRLLQEQLGERLDCPASSITENVIEENSKLRGAPENLCADLRELFQLCNQARYAPVRGTAELNSVADKFEMVIHGLQEVNA
ncbi:MAG TPA: BatD family protein [Verrucomicrobiae bacterium]|nr:BatD family protein [Verrucomicrobiae bacterium]